MVRYILIALSLLLAADEFTRVGSQERFATVTGHILAALSYGFTPAAGGAVVALIKRAFGRWRGKPNTFPSDWNWAWGVLLAILWIAHLLPQFRS
jgi:hypothetical protein